MTAEEILALARGIAQDTRVPYLWSQSEFLQYYNRSVDDVCRRVKHLRDSSTASICEVKLLSGVHTYSYSSKIVEIISAKLANETNPLTRKSEAWMDQNYSGWRTNEGTPRVIIPETERNKFRVYPYFDDAYVIEGSSNITFTAPNTISKTSGLSVFAADDEINASGTILNGTDTVPKVFTVVTASDTALVVSETVVNEVGTSAVLRRVEDVLNLSVARLPLTWVTIVEIASSSPPVDDDFHLDFIHGILGYAYLKDGTETYDPNQAVRHRGLFEGMISKIKREQINKTYVEDTCGPARGAM